MKAVVPDDPLKVYREKRDFGSTPEPGDTGREPGAENRTADFPRTAPIFVIQKHAASTLHYDFRLEAGSVLKSWAVPKGPSTNPRDKRLAVPTEDHPLEYADFEGVIPKGEYGGGTVLVWDMGTYRNLSRTKDSQEVPVTQAVANGHVTVWLDGKKLRGGYSFIRTGRGEEARWLLVKVNDSEADATQDIVSARPESALSGRAIEEIAQAEENPRYDFPRAARVLVRSGHRRVSATIVAGRPPEALNLEEQTGACPTG